LRLSPRDRRARHLSGFGISHFLSRRFDDAAAKLVVSLEEIPTRVVNLPLPRILLRAFGSARPSARDRQAPPHYHPRRGTERRSLPKSGAP
jgi:hypothetical protein